MPAVVVNVAVIHENRILLTQREDFETWILPSGGVEDGESIAQAAIRETKEETGLDVELTSLVGIYSRLGNMLSNHAILFVAKPTGGEIRCQEGETIAVEWFPFDEIPGPLSVGQEQKIRDAIAGKSGVVMLQEIKIPSFSDNLTRRELLELRDQSGLSRQDFYTQTMKQAHIQEKVEVGHK
jgi:ADP-ribose pyrophosphatase YjhB (NUDIX family)